MMRPRRRTTERGPKHRGRKCKTGHARQALADALRQVRETGVAWVNRDGYRLKLVPPYCPSEGECVHSLVRNGSRVTQEVIVGKDAGYRVRVYGSGRRAGPDVVLATIEERHRIHGARTDGRWQACIEDTYPGEPRDRSTIRRAGGARA